MIKTKRGQVTIFIIIAVVIVLFTVLFFVFKGSLIGDLNSENKIIPDYAQDVKSKFDECLKMATDNTLIINSFQGGYYELPDNSLSFLFEELSFEGEVPYYFDGASQLLPSKITIENQLSSGIKEEIQNCVDALEFQQPVIVNYSFDNSEFAAILTDSQEISINSKIPLSIVLNDSAFSFNSFSYTTKSDYLQLYSLAREITLQQKPDSICLTCIDGLAEKYKLNVSSIEIPGDADYKIIYFITSEKSEGVNLFAFAHRFNLE